MGGACGVGGHRAGHSAVGHQLQPHNEGVNAVAAETGMGSLVITHYQRILHIVKPQFVHIMFEGRIVKEGGPELVTALEERGYGWIREEVAAAA